MYTQPGNKSHATIRSHTSTVTFYTLLCFSLAGLIMGFAIGGFAGHLARGSAVKVDGPTTSAPVLTGHNPSPSPTATPENTFLGVPAIATSDYTSPEHADGNTTYQLSAQIINKADSTPITVTDVTCRLWLTDDPQGTAASLSSNGYAVLRDPTTFNQPFPKEIQGALTFVSPSQQTQPCAANGKTKWSYTLATSVSRGSYDLVVLADWKGVHYNWYMVQINVRNHGNGDNGDNGNDNNGGDDNNDNGYSGMGNGYGD